MIDRLGDWLLVSGFVAALTFVAGYMRVRWASTEAGRNVMALMAVIALLLGLAAARIVFGINYPGREWIRLGSVILLNIALWWRTVLLWRTTHRTAPDDRSQPGSR